MNKSLSMNNVEQLLRTIVDREMTTKTHESLFMCYFWGFSYLQPITKSFTAYSTQILFTFTLIIVALDLSLVFKNGLKVSRSLIKTCFVMILLVVDTYYRSSNYFSEFATYIIVFGFIPIFILSQVMDFKLLGKLYIKYSIIVYILFIFEPFLGFVFFSNYMSYGYLILLPSYLGIHLGRKKSKKRWLLVLEIICLLESVLFASRGMLLSIGMIWFIEYIIEFNIDRKRNLLDIGVLITFIFTLVANIKKMIQFFYLLVNTFGGKARTVLTLIDLFEDKDMSRFFSGRFGIWDDAFSMIKENVIFGSGTGSFITRYGSYSHNIFMDFTIRYGIVGLLVFLVIFIIAVILLYRSSNKDRISIGTIFFCLFFPKLLISSDYIREMSFWSFFLTAYMIKDNYYLMNMKQVWTRSPSDKKDT